MAETIIKIISLSKEEKEKIIQKAKITIEQNHSDTKMVSDMMTLYNQVLNQ